MTALTSSRVLPLRRSPPPTLLFPRGRPLFPSLSSLIHLLRFLAIPQPPEVLALGSVLRFRLLPVSQLLFKLSLRRRYLLLSVFELFEQLLFLLLHLSDPLIVHIRVTLRVLKLKLIKALLEMLALVLVLHSLVPSTQFLTNHLLLKHFSVLSFYVIYLLPHIHSIPETPVHLSLHVQPISRILLFLLSNALLQLYSLVIDLVSFLL